MRHETGQGRANCPACIEAGFTKQSDGEHDAALLALDDDKQFESGAEAEDYLRRLLRGF